MVITNSSTLNGRYVIQSVLGEVGPFDVSYLAYDRQSENKVVLREYYPLQFAKRASDGLTLEVNDAKPFEYGLGAYTAEAYRLFDMHHRCILNVIDNFKENGTIYTVTDYIPGASTYGYMTQQGGALDEELAYSIMESIMDGLQFCHDNKVYHGGIWPKAIHLSADNTPILMGFSQARFQLARHCNKLNLVRLPGFTAPEQTDTKIEPGPWWDVFGCAATLFYLLSGYQLSYQRDHFTEDDVKAALHRESSISAELRPVLEQALAFNHRSRHASIKAFHMAFEEVVQKNTVLLAQTNGHTSNGAAYSTSISAMPTPATNGKGHNDAIVDAREIEETTEPITDEALDDSQEDQRIEHLQDHEPAPDIEQVPEPESEQEPEPAPEARREPEPVPEAKRTPEPAPALAEDRTLPSNSIALKIKEEKPPRAVLIKESQRAPDAQPEPADRDVTQMLSRMVKWQQRLIALILGFAFLVVIAAVALISGPELFDFMKGPANALASGGLSEEEAGLLASASRATRRPSPEIAVDSNGVVFTQADIDSLFASIRAQVESEMGGSMPRSLQIGSGTTRDPYSSEPDEPENRQRTSRDEPENALLTFENQSQNEARETAVRNENRQSANQPREQDDEPNDTTEPALQGEDLASDSEVSQDSLGENGALIEPADSAASAQDLAEQALSAKQEAERLQALLEEREYQLYRSMGDSLLLQGLEDLAVQWYQSALQNRPEDTYVIAQIERIQSKKQDELAALDSMKIRRFAASDTAGVFYAPDVQPQLLNREVVYSSIEFPTQCRNRTQGGAVLARTIVDENGTTSGSSITKGLHPACDQEVLEALKLAEFSPATFDGEKVKAWFALRVEFTTQ